MKMKMKKYRNESIATVQLDMMESRLKKVRVKDGIINIVGLVLQKIEIAILSSVNYLAIYYIYYLHTYDKNISKENSLTLSSILVFAQFSTIFIGGILKEYIGMRLVMIIGGLFLILGSLGIIFFKSLTVYKIMMLFYGMGIGIPGSIANVNASLFIPERKGLINGISNIAWTLSCSLFNFVGLQVANPHSLDIEFKDEDKVKGKEYFNDDGESANNIITYTYVLIGLFLVLSVSSTVLTFSFKKASYEEKVDDLRGKKKKKINKRRNIGGGGRRRRR